MSFPNWAGCQLGLSYPQEDGRHVAITDFEFVFPTSEPTNEPFELEWESGSEPCTMKGHMGGSWENESESGAFSFRIVLRANGDSACGTLHYIERGFGPRELVTAAVAVRLP